MAESGGRLQSNIRPTYVVFILALVAFFASCIFSAARDWLDTPDLKANSFIAAVREFRTRQGVWPARLEQLGEVRALKLGTGAKISGSGKTLVVDNYLYVYTPYADLVSLWAIPIGSNRSYAKTHYVVFSLERVGDHWVGPPLSDDQVQYAVGDPGETRLIHMGMAKIEPQREKPGGGQSGGGDDRPREGSAKSRDKSGVVVKPGRS